LLCGPLSFKFVRPQPIYTLLKGTINYEKGIEEFGNPNLSISYSKNLTDLVLSLFFHASQTTIQRPRIGLTRHPRTSHNDSKPNKGKQQSTIYTRGKE